MKGKHFSGSPAADPAGDRPNRVRALFRGIKAQLEAAQGREIPFEESAQYAAQSTSSVFDKLQKVQQPQVEALLGWLERLPEPTRNRLINAACRSFPTIDHPRLSHDPAQASRLRTLLGKPSGLTLIQGGDDGLRTFVATALGHSYERLEPGRVGGIDVHEPDWFVPLTSVVYLHNLLEPMRLKEYVCLHWATVSAKKTQLVILNGIGSAVQGLEGEIRELTLQSHIVLADGPGLKPQLLRGALANTDVLNISEEKEQRIRVSVQGI